MAMYYNSRAAAGQDIADLLTAYQDQPTVVMALTNGGVAVGQSIAQKLNAELYLLLMRDIELPGEHSVLGSVDQDGGFTYNSMFSAGEIEYYVGEFHNFIDSQRMEKVHEINAILGHDGIVESSALIDQNVILVTDASPNGTAFETAASYLKPIRTKRLVGTTPIATIAAVDKLHIIADEIHVLAVTENFISVDHYYNEEPAPSQEQTLKILEDYKVKL